MHHETVQCSCSVHDISTWLEKSGGAQPLSYCLLHPLALIPTSAEPLGLLSAPQRDHTDSVLQLCSGPGRGVAATNVWPVDLLLGQFRLERALAHLVSPHPPLGPPPIQLCKTGQLGKGAAGRCQNNSVSQIFPLQLKAEDRREGGCQN